MIDKKEELLDAAEELFGELGFEGTSVRMLAKKAGVNIAMVSYYFGSKEKLFEALVESRAGVMRAQLITLNEKDIHPWEKMEIVIDFYIEKIFSNRCFHRILHREMTLQQRPELNEAIAKILLKNRLEVIKIIKEGQRKKVFKDIDVELTLASIIGTISHVAHSVKQIQIDDDKDDEKMKKCLKKHLKEMIKKHLTGK